MTKKAEADAPAKVHSLDMPPLPKNMKVHPFAQTFAILKGKEQDDLREDIKANGVVVPILVNKKRDTILDGRNRWMLASELGIQRDVPYDVFEGTDEEIPSEILRLNVFRRHLDDETRLAHIVKVRGPILEKEGKRKQAEAADVGRGKAGAFKKGAGETTVAQLAKESQASTYKTQQMEKVRKGGLIDDVIQKKMTLKEAAKKVGSKTHKPAKVLSFEDEVWARWKRFVTYWPQTQHRDVFKHVQAFITERRPLESAPKSTEKASDGAKPAKATAKKKK
jgi:ParB-like chromosome segregation protein Spo0J